MSWDFLTRTLGSPTWTARWIQVRWKYHFSYLQAHYFSVVSICLESHHPSCHSQRPQIPPPTPSPSPHTEKLPSPISSILIFLRVTFSLTCGDFLIQSLVISCLPNWSVFNCLTNPLKSLCWTDAITNSLLKTSRGSPIITGKPTPPQPGSQGSQLIGSNCFSFLLLLTFHFISQLTCLVLCYLHGFLFMRFFPL